MASSHPINSTDIGETFQKRTREYLLPNVVLLPSEAFLGSDTSSQQKSFEKLTSLRTLAKSDCNLSVRNDLNLNSSSEDITYFDILHDHSTTRKRFNSLASLLSTTPFDVRTNTTDELSSDKVMICNKRLLSGRALSPITFGNPHLSVLLNPDRPQTYEEEMKGEVVKLKSVILQMQQKVIEERRHNRHLSEQLRVQDTNYKGLIEKNRSRYDERFAAFKEKASLLVNKYEQLNREKSALEEKVIRVKCAWMVEKKDLESVIENLKREIEEHTSKRSLSNYSQVLSSDSEGIVPSDSISQSEKTFEQTNWSSHEKPDSTVDSNVNDTPSDQTNTMEETTFTHWDDFYKILYEICINKLTVLENYQQETQAKDVLSKSLAEFGHLNLFNELLLNSMNHDRTSESVSTAPEDSNSYSENAMVRRSSSCPYLTEIGTKKENLSSQTPPSLMSKSGPQSESRTFEESPKNDRSPTRTIRIFVKNRTVDLSQNDNADENYAIMRSNDASSSASPSPVRSSPTSDVFSRQKLQYRHVRSRQPKRTVSETHDKTLLKERNTTNSLPAGTNVSQLEDSVNSFQTATVDTKRLSSGSSSPPRQCGWSRNPIQSNFERLCHRRNGLINPEIRCNREHKIRHITVIDKLGINLKSHIGQVKERSGTQ